MGLFISLLRGINVSGKNLIKMESLRSMYEDLGFQNVRSYIQSGNMVFESPTASACTLRETIEKAIYDTYGYRVVVIIRTQSEIGRILERNPFAALRNIDVKKLCVVFLAGDPPDSSTINVDGAKIGNDEYAIVDSEIYLHCPDGFARTRLSNVFWEKKLSVTATTRNWNTVNALFDLTVRYPDL